MVTFGIGKADCCHFNLYLLTNPQIYYIIILHPFGNLSVMRSVIHMLKKIVASIIVIAMFILVLPALAAAPDSRFMSNDHDALVIGEIIAIENDMTVIRSVDFIVSTRSMPPIREQLRPEIVRVDLSQIDMDFYIDNYVIVSLDHIYDDIFRVAWGIYKVSSLDYQTLIVNAAPSDFALEMGIDTNYFSQMSAMFTDFVNSGGRYNEFAGTQQILIRRYNGEETVIWEMEEVAILLENDEREPELPIRRTGNQNYILFAILGIVLIVAIIFGVYKKLKST